MMKVIQTDLLSERGLRNVIDSEVKLIFGFEFHIRGKLGSFLLTPFTTNIERVAGILDISDFAKRCRLFILCVRARHSH